MGDERSGGTDLPIHATRRERSESPSLSLPDPDGRADWAGRVSWTGQSTRSAPKTRTIAGALARVGTLSLLLPKHSESRTTQECRPLAAMDAVTKDDVPLQASTAAAGPAAASPQQPPPPTTPRANPKPGLVATPRRVGKGGVPFLPPYSPKDTLCAFCGGDRSHNRHNRSEDMVSCYECGSSGHPTCLEWDDWALVKRVKSYPWLCQECKRCEVCDEKGPDDDQDEAGEDDLMFCDACDRGWHRLCLDPPLAAVPRGKWTCPTCVRQSEFAATPILPPEKAKRERRQAKPLGLVATPSASTLEDEEGGANTAGRRKSTRERRPRLATTSYNAYADGGSGASATSSQSPPPPSSFTPRLLDSAPGPSKITFKAPSHFSTGGDPSRLPPPSKRLRLSAASVASGSPAGLNGSSSTGTALYQPWLEPRFPSPPPPSRGDYAHHLLQQQQHQNGAVEEPVEEEQDADPDPYGGLLTASEADGTGRVPGERDREKWVRARAEWERREWARAAQVQVQVQRQGQQGAMAGGRAGGGGGGGKGGGKGGKGGKGKGGTATMSATGTGMGAGGRESSRPSRAAAAAAARFVGGVDNHDNNYVSHHDDGSYFGPPSSLSSSFAAAAGPPSSVGASQFPQSAAAAASSPLVVAAASSTMTAMGLQHQYQHPAPAYQNHHHHLPHSGSTTTPSSSSLLVGAGASSLASTSALPQQDPSSSFVPGYSLPIRPITHLRIGEFDLETWYQAPFPEEYTRVPEGVLWVCEWCLKYVKSAFENERHKVRLSLPRGPFFRAFLPVMPMPLVICSSFDPFRSS